MAATPQNLHTQGILIGRKQLLQQVTAIELFERVAHSEAKSKVAVIGENETLLFSELNSLANRWASIILEKLLEKRITSMVSKPPIIGIFMRACPLRLVIILAVFKLKAAYVPFDCVLPKDRIVRILNETEASLLVCDNHQVSRDYEKCVDVINVLETDEYDLDTTGEDKHPWLDQLIYEVDEDPLLCVLYTSGSTGEPNGVPLHSNNLLNRLVWQWETFPFSSSDIGCHKTSLVFVDSLTEIFCCLLNGTTLVIIPKHILQSPKQLLDTIEEMSISRLVLVPSLLATILKEVKLSHRSYSVPLKMVICSGETLKPDLATEFLEWFPDTCLANFYGSTETTGDVTYDKFDSVQDIMEKTHNDSLSIGTPVLNTDVMIVDDNMDVVEEGQVGQIVLAGFNIISNYFKVSTTDKITQNPFTSESNYPHVFKTGDLGMIIGKKLYFQGRLDLQVKVRGHKINLREIESTMERHESIKHVTVLKCDSLVNRPVIVAFYQLHHKYHGTVMKHSFIGHLKATLPAYMLPVLYEISVIPLQPQSGKIDLVQLKKLYSDACRKYSDEELQSLPVIDLVKAVIAQETGSPPFCFDLNDNFFDIGGCSISALSVLSRLIMFGYTISMQEFGKAKSIQMIIDVITGPAVLETQNQDGLCKVHFKPLTSDENIDDITNVIAESFCERGLLVFNIGLTPDNFGIYVKTVLQTLLKDGLSVGVYDVISGKLLGVSINMDLNTKSHAQAIPAYSMALEIVATPVKVRRNNLLVLWLH